MPECACGGEIMCPQVAKIIQAAAVAGWWTVLIGVIWMTVGWLIWRQILSSKPEWVRKFWGVDMDWSEIQSITIKFIAVWKLILFVCVLACIWLTLWA